MQSLEHRGFEHLLRAAPAPIARGNARYIHSSLYTQIQQVLQRSDREAGLRGPHQADEVPSDFAEASAGSRRISAGSLTNIIRQRFAPTSGGVVVVCPRIGDGVR